MNSVVDDTFSLLLITDPHFRFQRFHVNMSTANVTEPNPVIPDNRLFIDRIRIT